MQDFRSYSSEYLVPTQFNNDLTCFEVLSDTCDEDSLECLSLRVVSEKKIDDFSALVEKNHETVDEGLSQFAEDLIFNFQNPCVSSALVSEFENHNEFLRPDQATPSADWTNRKKEILDDHDSPGFGYGSISFASCLGSTVESKLNNFRWSFADTCISPCSTSHLQSQTPNDLFTYIILDHNYSKIHGTLLKELGHSMENSLSAEDEVEQVVPFSQSNQNVDSERILSSCVDHHVPHLCVEE